MRLFRSGSNRKGPAVEACSDLALRRGGTTWTPRFVRLRRRKIVRGGFRGCAWSRAIRAAPSQLAGRARGARRGAEARLRNRRPREAILTGNDALLRDSARPAPTEAMRARGASARVLVVLVGAAVSRRRISCRDFFPALVIRSHLRDCAAMEDELRAAALDYNHRAGRRASCPIATPTTARKMARLPGGRLAHERAALVARGSRAFLLDAAKDRRFPRRQPSASAR